MARIIDKTISTSQLDTNVFNPITGDGITPVGFSMTETSKKVAGVAKIVNMFVKLMMTPKGSNPLSKSEGSYFYLIMEGSVKEEDVIFSNTQDAISDVVDQIKNMQLQVNAPQKEKVQDASITGFESIGQDGMRIEVTIALVTGSNIVIELPSIVLT